MALTGVKRIEELAALAEDGEYFDIYVFASLVQADVREALAQHFEEQPFREMFGGTVADEIRARGN
jgi:hypothetical protein